MIVKQERIGYDRLPLPQRAECWHCDLNIPFAQADAEWEIITVLPRNERTEAYGALGWCGCLPQEEWTPEEIPKPLVLFKSRWFTL